MIYLIITRTDWEEPPRARHQLARELAKTHNVIFVSINKNGNPRIQTNSPQKNITLITPYWFLDGKYIYRIPILNEVYQYWLYSKLKKYANCRVINFDPSATLLHKFFDDVVYFCNDDFTNIRRAKSLVTKLYFHLSQRIIAKNARFCTAVSEYLKDQLSLHTDSSHLILTAAEQLNISPKYINSNNSTINAVYVGWISKINKEWILSLSQKKNIVIQLIGPYEDNNFKELIEKENIHFLGQKTGEKLANFLEKADVCLAPYIIGRDTEEVYTMPNKFWLYLNYGHPIVTCEIKRLYSLPTGFVYQAKNENEFTNAVIKAHSENSEKKFLERLLFIKKNNWGSRVNQIINLYK